MKKYMFEIEKGIPIPERTHGMRDTKNAYRGGNTRKYPLREMVVGDSFCAGEYTAEVMIKVINVALSFARRDFPDRKYTARKMADGTCRLWRTN